MIIGICELCGSPETTAHAHDLDAGELAYIEELVATGVVGNPAATDYYRAGWPQAWQNGYAVGQQDARRLIALGAA